MIFADRPHNQERDKQGGTMKKIGNIVLGGIQQKIYNLVLYAIFLVIAAYTAVLIYQSENLTKLTTETNNRQKESIAEISAQTMDSVLSSTMVNTTQMQAYIANDLFTDVSDKVMMLGDYAEKIFAEPESYPFHDFSMPDASKEGEVTVQLLIDEDANLNDPDLNSSLGLIANMSDMMISLYEIGGLNSCYIALPNGVMLLADEHSGEKFDEHGNMMFIPINERDWYNGAKETGKLFFTDVVQDVFTGQIGIMVGYPVYRDDELAAVVGADLFLDKMAEAIDASDENGSFEFIVNGDGHVIFSPKTTGSLRVKTDAVDLRDSENRDFAQFIRDAMQQNTDVQLAEIDGTAYYLAGAPIGTVGWVLVSAVSKEVTDQPAVLMEERYEGIYADAQESFSRALIGARRMIIVLLIISVILGTAGGLIMAKRIVAPLETMTRKVSSLGGDNLQFRMEPAYKTGDEIEVLAESFETLSAKTVQYIDQVQKVTAEKERIGAELTMATAIQASQLPRLFPAFPNRNEFDLYASMTPAKEVGGDFYDFFMIDDDHIAMVMADVSGKGGPAALFMMVSRVLLKTHLQNGESLSEALSNVNNQLCESNDAEFFVTVWAGVLEISTGKGKAANAGHEHPALRRADGCYELIVYQHSPAVATMEGVRFREHEFELHPGDSFFVYTDGVTEATNMDKELFGNGRLLSALNHDPEAGPEETLKNVMNGISEFVDGAEQFDDITMLCMKYYGPEGQKEDGGQR